MLDIPRLSSSSSSSSSSSVISRSDMRAIHRRHHHHGFVLRRVLVLVLVLVLALQIQACRPSTPRCVGDPISTPTSTPTSTPHPSRAPTPTSTHPGSTCRPGSRFWMDSHRSTISVHSAHVLLSLACRSTLLAARWDQALQYGVTPGDLGLKVGVVRLLEMDRERMDRRKEAIAGSALG